MATVVNKDVSIANNAGVDVIAIDAFQASGGAGSALAAQQMYEQTLTALEAANGARSIAAGASATVALDGTCVDGTGTTQ